MPSDKQKLLDRVDFGKRRRMKAGTIEIVNVASTASTEGGKPEDMAEVEGPVQGVCVTATLLAVVSWPLVAMKNPTVSVEVTEQELLFWSPVTVVISELPHKGAHIPITNNQ